MPASDGSVVASHPSAMSLFLTFFKIGAFTFGGGFAMIPLIRRDLVENRGWIGDDEFLDIIGVAQCSPGPIAVNVAVFSGLKVFGLIGAITATAGVVLPSLITLSIIAAAYSGLKTLAWVESIFEGIRPAVAGLIAQAAWSLARRTLTAMKPLILFAGILLASLFLNLHPALAIVLGSAAGFLVQPGAPRQDPSPQEAQQS